MDSDDEWEEEPEDGEDLGCSDDEQDEEAENSEEEVNSLYAMEGDIVVSQTCVLCQRGHATLSH